MAPLVVLEAGAGHPLRCPGPIAIGACAKGRQRQRALQPREDGQGEGVPAGTITHCTAVGPS